MDESEELHSRRTKAPVDIHGKSDKMDTRRNVLTIMSTFVFFRVSESNFWKAFIPSRTGGVDNPDINMVLLIIEKENKIGLDSVIYSVTGLADGSESDLTYPFVSIP